MLAIGPTHLYGLSFPKTSKVEHMSAKYIVIAKKNRTTRTFDSAEQVSVFMLGRRFDEWAIYQLQDSLPADVHKCQTTLENREKSQSWTILGEI